MRILFTAALAALTLSSSVARAQPAFDTTLLEPRYVEVEPGRRLHLRCVGVGSPTVVFEQGGEGMIFNWSRVQPAVAEFTRTCVYDRAGFGWSDPPRAAVTAINVTSDLNAALRESGVEGPIVLVGHSIGGFYATMYADRFLPQVAGLVLVDPGFTGQSSGLEGAAWDHDQSNIRRGENYLLRCAEAARQGKLNEGNLADLRCYPLPKVESSAARAYALHAVTNPHWYAAEHSQSVHYFSADKELSVSHQQEHDASRSFGDLPMIVLTAGESPNDSWRTEAGSNLYQQRWSAGHAKLAERSNRGERRIINGADHFIQLTKPDAVIQAVREVVDAARTTK